MKRLKDIKESGRLNYKSEANKVVDIALQDNAASKRMVLHSAKRAIAVHKNELEKLAYK
ncbi:hypothetical protein [Neisseria perflava]|uniref:hypothetical protein n=1 Tax=Neisseria perflava TaxID=33053 RepID=UPI0020A15DB3|nr:hypothetical protein [Neisseria perflava]MCP1659879.1 hypothetical protein [Neisseria perflava]MCP1772683.1 hypothetical protein [Neisseria perflava]